MINEEELKPEVVGEIIDKCEFTERTADYSDIKDSFIKKTKHFKIKAKNRNYSAQNRGHPR